jgi:hypothetical protein
LEDEPSYLPVLPKKKLEEDRMKPLTQLLGSKARKEFDVTSLVGEWEVSSPQFPTAVGQTVVEWFPNSAYLIFRSIAPEPIPCSTWIIGSDDSSEVYTALYCDSRGVSRVYKMSLHNRSWRIWRENPDFSQRFTGVLSEDLKTIRGAWEIRQGKSPWKHDFDVTYKKLN